jgi:hypothetical protein
VVPPLHSAATVRAADELITLQGDLNANWFSILTVERAWQCSYIQPTLNYPDSAGRTHRNFLLLFIVTAFGAKAGW